MIPEARGQRAEGGSRTGRTRQTRPTRPTSSLQPSSLLAPGLENKYNPYVSMNSQIELARQRIQRLRERYRDDALIAQRADKLDALLAKQIDPFKNKFTPGETCRHAHDHYTEGREVALAGRITAHRD